MNKSLGQIAYEAYANSVGWWSFYSETALPHWDDVDERIQQAWEAAAQAVIEERDSERGDWPEL